MNPKLPAKLVELRGTARADRARGDAEGAGPFGSTPPTWLDPSAVPAWHQLVERLPRVALTSSDEILVEATALVLTMFRRTHDHRAALALRSLLVELGMSPMARVRLAGAGPAKVSKFERIRDAGTGEK